MSDPRAKHWLADDANFLATLGDLDRGLGGTGDDFPSTDAQHAAAEAHPAAPPPAPSGAPVTPRPRPLLDLFPEWALLPESSAAPAAPESSALRAPAPAGDAPRRPRPPMLARRSEPAVPSQLDALTYEPFYGLREKPFSLSTDPRFEYGSASHQRVGEELIAAIHAHSGPTVLSAPRGMGKTTLCRALVQGIDRHTVTALVLDPVESLDDLLKTMLVDFGVIAREDLAGAAHPTRPPLTSTLNTFLESLVPLEAAAVVFIDEAQSVPVDLLGDLAAALAPATSGAGVLRLVLVGQPSLTKRLTHPDLRGLHASIGRRLVLGPLTAGEVSGYVAHRLSVAGGQGRIAFDEAAIAVLFQLSAGVPRVVNLLCDRALSRGHQASADVIDGALIEAAAADLDLQPSAEGPGLLGRLLIVAVFALLVLAGAAGALWSSRDAVNRTILQWEQMPLPPGGPVRRLSVPIAPIPPPDVILDSLQRRPAI